MFITIVSFLSYPTTNQMIPVILFEKAALCSLWPLMKYKSSWAGRSVLASNSVLALIIDLMELYPADQRPNHKSRLDDFKEGKCSI